MKDDKAQIVVYVHGKGGSAEEAKHYIPLFPDCSVIGFDYHAQTPWDAKEEFPRFFSAQRKRCDRLTLIANSIGAFFSMSALDAALVDRAYLISPVVDMEKLIGDMPLVLHGGTGIPTDMIKKAISLGVSKINVNTECQLAFAEATREYIEAGKDLQGKGYDPRKLLAPGAEAIKKTVKEKMEIFGSVDKA